MYFDRHGKPAADGHYEKINGKLTIRNGGRITFDVQLMDSRPARGAFLTDAASAADPRKAIKEARSAWLADKATAYRSGPRDLGAAVAQSQIVATDNAAPSGRTAIADARSARLARLETAYRGEGR